MLTKDEEYKSKSELAEEMLEKLISVYNIERVIFDAGFCVPSLLKMLDFLSIKYICRYPKSRKLIYKNKSAKVESIFKNATNASYYYYKDNGYLNSSLAKYADHDVQIVVVANTKEKLIKKDFYCLLTNDLDLKYPTVLKTYKKRGKIEDLFKIKNLSWNDSL